MRTMKRTSAAAAVAILALGLGACSEAEKAADDAKKKAGEQGSSLAADASEKADAMKSDATGKGEADGSDGSTDGAGDGPGDGAGDGSGDGAGGDVTVDLGDYTDDPAAKAVGAFYTARETVRNGGDSAALEAVTSAEHLERVLTWAKSHPSTGPFQVVVNSVDGSTVNTCIGPNANGARALTVEDGKVTANVAGDFTC